MNIEFSIGLHILGFLASRNGKPLTSVTMAKTFGTSPVVLRRVLTRLNQSGLVKTNRGVGGGSVLARDSKKINLREVYESVSTNKKLFGRHPEGNEIVSKVLGEYINEFYDEAEQSILSHLESITVSDMDAVVRPKIISALQCEQIKR